MGSKKIVAKKSNSGLNDRQLQFIDQYLIDFNATQACIRCGYSKRTASEQASRLLGNAKIQQEMAKRFEKTADKVGITRERTMNEIGRIAFSDIRKFFDSDGNLLAVTDLDDEASAALASLDMDELFAGSGEMKLPIGVTKKIKLWDKLKALEMLAKHFKIYSDAPVTSNTITLGYGPEKPV